MGRLGQSHGQARPKPQLSGQARPEHHYSELHSLFDCGWVLWIGDEFFELHEGVFLGQAPDEPNILHSEIEQHVSMMRESRDKLMVKISSSQLLGFNEDSDR
jgi:hypothetical protein